MRIVITPDSFKGTVEAAAAAEALAAGWRSVRPADEIVLLPMADGGEGTLDAIATAVPEARRVPVTVPGPDDRPVDSAFLLLPDGTAVVELAATSGLALLDRPRPLTAHTRGFGVAIRAALDCGATALLLAIGGSGSTDGGAGVLDELGARIGAGDVSSLRPLPPGGVRVLTDVVNPLLGPTGAAAVYGPQKGASPADVAMLEARLARLVTLLRVDPRTPGAGAAGGTGYGLLAWGARLVPGAQEVARMVGLPTAIVGADLVVTGEGRFDAQSASGKVASQVRALADRAGVPVALVAGAIEADTTGFASAISLTALVGRATAMSDPRTSLHAAAAALARASLDG